MKESNKINVLKNVTFSLVCPWNDLVLCLVICTYIYLCYLCSEKKIWVTVQWLNIKPVFMFLFCSLICTWTHEKTCWLYFKYVHLIGWFGVKISLGHSTIEEPFGVKLITKISKLRFNFLLLTIQLLLPLDLLYTVPQCNYVTLPVCTCSVI